MHKNESLAEAGRAEPERILAEEAVTKALAEPKKAERTDIENAAKAIAEAKALTIAETEKAAKAMAVAKAEVEWLRKEMEGMRAEIESSKHEQVSKKSVNELEESRKIIESSTAEVEQLRQELDGLRHTTMQTELVQTRRCGRIRKAISRVTSGAVEKVFSLPDETVIEVYNEISMRLKEKGLIA